MKVPTLVSMPKGSDKSLEDLKGWQLEFDRYFVEQAVELGLAVACKRSRLSYKC